MAYMTEFNFQKLISKVDINVKITKELFLNEIYPDGHLYDILNDFERTYFFKYAMLIKDEEGFITKYYKFVPEEPDTEQLVFSEGGKIKYHLDSACEMLTKDFKDFYIPEEIRNFGSDAVNEFRAWFKENGFKEKFDKVEISLQKINRAFNNKYVSKYSLTPLNEDSGILVFERPNSCNLKIDDSFDVLTCKSSIDDLLKEFSNHFIVHEAQKVAKHSYLINSDKDKIVKKLKEILPVTPISDKNFDGILADLRTAYNILRQITFLLKDYIKWTYDFTNKNFDSITLEDLGLVCCKACSVKE